MYGGGHDDSGGDSEMYHSCDGDDSHYGCDDNDDGDGDTHGGDDNDGNGGSSLAVIMVMSLTRLKWLVK